MFELLFMTKCVNYMLFILSLFFWVFQCRIIARPSYILCTKSAVPCRSPVRHNKIFPEEPRCSCFGGNWSLMVRRMAKLSEGGAGTPTAPPSAQSVGSVPHNGRGDQAGWDEDSFHKVLLRQRSLPSLRAITPTVNHKEAGCFPHTHSHWGQAQSYEMTGLEAGELLLFCKKKKCWSLYEVKCFYFKSIIDSNRIHQSLSALRDRRSKGRTVGWHELGCGSVCIEHVTNGILYSVLMWMECSLLPILNSSIGWQESSHLNEPCTVCMSDWRSLLSIILEHINQICSSWGCLHAQLYH